MHHFLSNSRFSSTHSAHLVDITSTKEPHTYAQAILNPNWQKTMEEEFSALLIKVSILINNEKRKKKLQTIILIHFKFELDRPFRMLYPCHELVNTKNLVSRWLISNILS